MKLDVEHTNGRFSEKFLREEIMRLAKALQMITYSVKSCRAGDGDDRSWKQCAEDCESYVERVLESIRFLEPEVPHG